MRLKFNQTMATAIEPLVVDPQSRFLEMKSLQPYSTKDEYLYAMKEDLADWLSNMYPDWCPITADNFVECLENGALLCHHANNVNDAARKVDPSLSSLTNCKYRLDARPKTFNARDNVSQFIKWARNTAGVREVLMFESDDLILRKNEKNFILCLLEIARFGAKFGMSVPNIIKLEQEIEREIERDKEIEKILTDSQHSDRRQREDYENQFDSTEYQSMQTNQYDSTDYQLIRDDENELDSNNYQLVVHNNENQINSNNYQLVHNNENEIDSNSYQLIDNNENQIDSHTVNWLQQQQQQHLLKMSNNNNSKHRHGSEESYDSTTSSEITTAVVSSNEEKQFSRVSVVKHKPMVAPASSSHLHKTVVNIVNSCNCSHRFPVIRIGEGKYRIGENGTIIFIRILRNHVMVRVGGGWDTLENYLNKHDPCREKGGHRRSEHHQHHHHNHSDIPILAIPNTNISPSVQKNTPYGKSVTIKTEEFPLAKPSNHDTNLVDAQLVITRGADGRHHIGQITYKSEEDVLNQQPACPQHQHQHTSTSPSKMKSARSTGCLAPISVFTKQSSPSTDQDYSSLAETTNHSKPSSSSSLDLKEDSIEQPIQSLDLITNTPVDRPIQRYSSTNKSRTQPLVQDIDHSFESSPSPSKQNISNKNSGITESVIGNIDGNIYSTSVAVEHDFDINDIEDVLGISNKQNSDEKAIIMDNDSLENSEGAIEEKKKKTVLPPSSTRKSSGATSTSHTSQRQKFQQEQTTSRRRPPSSLNRYALRSGTLPNVPDAVKKEEQINKQRRKPITVSKRSQSSEVIEKLQDISKLDRDSGFDEQDFPRERLLSNGDDNSSISSIKSTRSSTIHSINYEIRENKAYELRMKKLDSKRTSIENNSPSKPTRSIDSSSRRASELVPPPPTTTTTTTPSRYRKNSQPNVNIKQQQQQQQTSPNKKTNS